MLKFEKTLLDGVLIIKPDTFEDFRGEYTEIWNKDEYNKLVVNKENPDKIIEWVTDDISITLNRTLKGIHGNNSCYKLISCLYGKFYIVVLNYNKDSKDFGKWLGFTLSDKNRWQLLVPPKFGNGHVALSDMSIFHYKQSEYYNPKSQFTIYYADPRFNIWWPIKNPIISRRDETSNEVNNDEYCK